MKLLVYILLCVHCLGAIPCSNEVESAALAITKCFDIDGDGNISRAEMVNYLTNESSFDTMVDKIGGRNKFVIRYFKEHDLDSDGVVDETELKNIVLVYTKTLKEGLRSGNITELYSSNPQSKTEATKMFECYDLNGNGLVTRKELNQFFRCRRSYNRLLRAVGGRRIFVKGWIIQHDLDKNRVITKQEFVDVARVFLHMIEKCRGKVVA